jgi:hypothetical protein
MYKIIINLEDGRKDTIQCVISKQQHKRIEKAQFLGGFKRFDIELYSDNEPTQKSEITKALMFLCEKVFFCKIEELQKFI